MPLTILASCLALAVSNTTLAQSGSFARAGEAFERDLATLRDSHAAPSVPSDPVIETIVSYIPPHYLSELPDGRPLTRQEIHAATSGFVEYERSLRSYYATLNSWYLPVRDELRYPDSRSIYPSSPHFHFSGELGWIRGGRWASRGIETDLHENSALKHIHFIVNGDSLFRTRVIQQRPGDAPGQNIFRTSGIVRQLSPVDRALHPSPDSAMGRELFRSFTPFTLAQTIERSHEHLVGRRLEDGSIVLRGPLDIAGVLGGFGIHIRLLPEIGHAPAEIVTYEGRLGWPSHASQFFDYQRPTLQRDAPPLPHTIATTVLTNPERAREALPEIERLAEERGFGVADGRKPPYLGTPGWTDVLRESMGVEPPMGNHGPFGWETATLKYHSVNTPLPEDMFVFELPEDATIVNGTNAVAATWDGQRLVPIERPAALVGQGVRAGDANEGGEVRLLDNGAKPQPPPDANPEPDAEPAADADPEHWFQSRLAMDSYVGEVHANQRAHRSIRFENIGDHLLSFEVVARSCSCVDIRVPEDAVEPGQIVAIDMTAYDPGPRTGVIRHEADVAVTLLDPRDPDGPGTRAVMRIPIEFSLRDAIAPVPSRLNIELLPAERRTVHLYLRGNTNPIARIAKVHTDSPAITVGTPTPSGDHACAVEILIDAAQLDRSQVAYVHVAFTDDARPAIRVPVSLRLLD
ncbi:MAG: DUF1573 domain-containing protein [Phycisphaerales bacterium]